MRSISFADEPLGDVSMHRLAHDVVAHPRDRRGGRCPRSTLVGDDRGAANAGRRPIGVAATCFGGQQRGEARSARSADAPARRRPRSGRRSPGRSAGPRRPASPAAAAGAVPRCAAERSSCGSATRLAPEGRHVGERRVEPIEVVLERVAGLGAAAGAGGGASAASSLSMTRSRASAAAGAIGAGVAGRRPASSSLTRLITTCGSNGLTSTPSQPTARARSSSTGSNAPASSSTGMCASRGSFLTNAATS